MVPCPKPGSPFFGQDAQYQGNAPAFLDNDDGTITGLVTGLTWSRAVDAQKVSLEQALKIAEKMTLAGYSDWRVPTIKELYSLINFSGYTGQCGAGVPGNSPGRPVSTVPGKSKTSQESPVPFINTDYFNFKYGNTRPGRSAVYIAFGRTMEQMHGQTIDVHGAGAQRSDSKTDQPALGHGPQGDAVRIENYVRLVPGGG